MKGQPCNLGMQDKYVRSFWQEGRAFAVCGVYNEEIDVDFTERPCCCDFCGQRDPFEQICEISQLLCTSVEDCRQRHGVCVERKPKLRGPSGFHVFWTLCVGGLTVAPFVVPVVALYAAQDIVLGLAG